MSSEEFLAICYKKLDKGLERLNLNLGIISHIENENYHLVAVRDDSDIFKAGADFSLGDTYCREVWNKGTSVSIPTENDSRKIQEHPLYANLPLEAYISSPIMHDSKIWGTINFSAQQARAPFNEEDIHFVERLAADISAALFHS
jgi:GAF domain-containing protein